MAENKATFMANPPPLITEARLQEMIDSRVQRAIASHERRFSVRAAADSGSRGGAVVAEIGELTMTGNRMNCSLWYWLRRPTEFNHLIRYCNAFGWRYFWRDSFMPKRVWLCETIGLHEWSWKLSDVGYISLDGPPPDFAACKHCGMKYGDIKNR